MKAFIVTLLLALFFVATDAKPRCKGFNNYDNKVTIVVTDDKAGDHYSVSDVKLIPKFHGEEISASSVSVSVDNGVATVSLEFPYVSQFSNPQVKLRINGKKSTVKVCK